MSKGGARLGAGRKKKADARTMVLQVRLSRAELDSVRETAKAHGMTPSDLVRTALGLRTSFAPVDF
jgi:hypothetical protein